jgi:uncharacterized protein
LRKKLKRRLIENSHSFRQIGNMKLTNFLIPTVLVAFGLGCEKAANSIGFADKSANPPPPPVPTQAQPKLPTMKIYLGAETLDTELATTPREEEVGMMFRTNIPETDSMLFVLPYPMAASFWMTNCPESLSAAYIGPDGVIEEIHHLEKNDNVPVVATNGNIQFVLETKDGWFKRHNIAVGTEIRTEKGSLSETFLGK